MAQQARDRCDACGAGVHAPAHAALPGHAQAVPNQGERTCRGGDTQSSNTTFLKSGWRL